jgi:RNA methyltransferase, TrmH family
VIRDIAGRQNHSVKLARKLQQKKHRRERGLLLGEGMDLLRAAVEAGADLRDVLVRRDLLRDLPSGLTQRAAGSGPGDDAGLHIGVCDEETLAYASSLGGSADVLFTSREPAWNLGDLDLTRGLTLFLDGVGDPGNVGTLVRSCAAFGAVGVVCSPGTADPYGPKALRGGMGAQFSVPIVTEVTAADLRAKLDRSAGAERSGPVVLVADPQAGEDVRGLSLASGAIVVLGAERRGPGAEWEPERRVTIPQRGFDSLNVAMAGTVLLYELSMSVPWQPRQR